MGIGRLHIGILVVNGTLSSWNKIPWLKLCLDNIVKYTTKRKYKVFLWNHDYRNRRVMSLLEKYKDHVIPFNETTVAVNKYNSPKMRSGGPLSWKGFHVHRTPLQIIYEISKALYDIDVIVTMDSDSWPIKDGWDDFFYQSLKSHKLVGVWRDEMKGGIKPFIHPSGLGIWQGFLEKEKLKFDKKPYGTGEDSLSHFSRHIHRKFGPRSLCKLRRSNEVNLHPVAGGIYGDMIYHHHLGTRFTKGMEPIFKGGEARGETAVENKRIIGEMTKRVFTDYNNYIKELRGIK